ncbi:choline ethanolamine kinase domain-containing protein [Cyclospora cayetanensis]|uniref:ethanolamine kinase n=1 Tax=Cyclospora cayetanensis TaxID=88456 RepID=A0A1D3CSV0_9EIME|nr:choline ethanolamine kinase domain-containing protein [Cyclospora cayetanensis]
MRIRCRSNSTGSTVDPEPPETDVQLHAERRQQQEDAIVAAALLKALQHGDLIRGGTTNTIVRVSKRGTDHPCCLVRFYGRSTSLWINRQRECAILRLLSHQGNGKQTLASFAGGVIESWLPGSPLTEKSLRFSAEAIAKALADLHNVSLHPTHPESVRLSALFPHPKSCLSERQRALSGTASDCLLKEDFAQLAEIVTFLEGMARGRGPVVLCHGDLLGGNIIKQPDGFDCEWENMPSLPEKEAFSRLYLQQQAAAAASLGTYATPDAAGAATAALTIDDTQVQKLLEEIQPFFAVSHLFWGLWAMLQAANSTCDFNFTQCVPSIKLEILPFFGVFDAI